MAHFTFLTYQWGADYAAGGTSLRGLLVAVHAARRLEHVERVDLCS